MLQNKKGLSMPVCATQEKIAETPGVYNLILPVPDTDFRDFIEEVEKFARLSPEIIEAIEEDLNANARAKKRLRLADKKFAESRTADLLGLDVAEVEVLANELEIGIGRPRMSAELVYLFVMVRGFLGGSLTSAPSKRFLRESMSLYDYLQRRGLALPGATTIAENVILVSQMTLDAIFDKQIKFVLEEELDDFKKLTIDSTSVKANTCWPTDAKMLTGLLTRADRLGQTLHTFGLGSFRQGWVPRWLERMDKLELYIALVAGKANSKGKLKRRYRQILKRGRKVADALTEELNCFELGLKMEALPPSRRVLLQRILAQIGDDIADAKRVVKYANDRVVHDKTLPSTEKVLSLSDGSAAYIKKGSRNAVIGYKPQLVRSENGLVTSLIVPEGNAADSAKLVPAISASIERTGVIADLVSTDDGYASASGRDEILGMDVGHISISGAKGKKLTDPDDWESLMYRDARRYRSAVESLMFTIKDGFEFGELARRGIDAVRAELTEKVLAYNCCRIIQLRKRRREALDKAA
jgi:IS5 family transposase